jgi:hypothetical protein
MSFKKPIPKPNAKVYDTGMALCKEIEPKKHTYARQAPIKELKKACENIPDTFVCEATGPSGDVYNIPNDKFLGYATLIRAKKYVDAMNYVETHGKFKYKCSF